MPVNIVDRLTFATHATVTAVIDVVYRVTSRNTRHHIGELPGVALLATVNRRHRRRGIAGGGQTVWKNSDHCHDEARTTKRAMTAAPAASLWAGRACMHDDGRARCMLGGARGSSDIQTACLEQVCKQVEYIGVGDQPTTHQSISSLG